MIDRQCQGQEADLVILSLVRKPTIFLNKNRMNVDLSRTRKELIIRLATEPIPKSIRKR
jgi:superfamily I DNA and/or RNA helicase